VAAVVVALVVQLADSYFQINRLVMHMTLLVEALADTAVQKTHQVVQQARHLGRAALPIILALAHNEVALAAEAQSVFFGELDVVFQALMWPKPKALLLPL
jgi:hypothetical protein